jgi:predicted small secreted protein
MGSRRTTRLLPAAVAVLALALSGCSGDGATEDASGATAGSSSPSEADGGSASATELTVDTAAGSGRCMVPNAEALATQTTAFEGTVTSLQEGTATLEVDRWLAGGESEQVTVAAPDDDLRALLSAVEFEVGKTYLVSAHERGQVTLCGFTAEKSPELEAMYTEAFAS